MGGRAVYAPGEAGGRPAPPNKEAGTYFFENKTEETRALSMTDKTRAKGREVHHYFSFFSGLSSPPSARH